MTVASSACAGVAASVDAGSGVRQATLTLWRRRLTRVCYADCPLLSRAGRAAMVKHNRLRKLDDADWQLDLHTGLSVATAVAVFAQTVAELPAGVTLEIIHGYGKSGSGGEIYLALYQVLALNRKMLAYRHPVLNGQPNIGCTLVQRQAAGELAMPVELQRLVP
ncbi:MAG: hypothetical protein EXR77_20260 [Myxococcales bacterium]|nr:hypothetical protein [Myxococcales bacterium]